MADVPACAASDDPRDCIGDGAELCMDQSEGGMSTVGMMSCLHAEADVWDVLLNARYAEALAFAKTMDDGDREISPGYAVRVGQVRDAQRAWITFRDANCAMEYGLWGSGSMRLIFGADCRLRMTSERTLDLQSYARDMY